MIPTHIGKVWMYVFVFMHSKISYFSVFFFSYSKLNEMILVNKEKIILNNQLKIEFFSP